MLLLARLAAFTFLGCVEHKEPVPLSLRMGQASCPCIEPPALNQTESHVTEGSDFPIFSKAAALQGQGVGASYGTGGCKPHDAGSLRCAADCLQETETWCVLACIVECKTMCAHCVALSVLTSNPQ